MFALNQGEVCTCPSRSLIQEDIFDDFLAMAAIRTKAVRQGDPLDTDTMIGAQASNDQLEKILSYIEIGKAEGAKVITGGERAQLGGDLAGGYYVQPTVFTGNNKMRIFQEEIFDRSCPSRPSRITTRPSNLPMTPSTVSARASGRVTVELLTVRAAISRPAECGPTRITSTRHTPPSVDTSSPVSAARTT